jgi:hypothetical protein
MKNMIMISVGSYAAVSSAVFVLYYAALLVVFRLKDRMRIKPVTSTPDLHTSFLVKEEQAPDTALYTTATLLTDELKAFFDAFSHDDLSKEELAFRLRKILQKYSGITDALKETINHYIHISSAENFAVDLSDEELHQLYIS